MDGRSVSFSKKVFRLVLNSHGTPLITLLALLSILFVLFRMKSIEQDYKYNEFNSKIENALFENKELKAKKAKLLSNDNLRNLAKKHGLESPKEDQIIIVP